MDEMLKAAAEAGDINKLYASIRDDSYLLDRVDHVPFVETPLHIAASLGHTKLAMEIMRLKPSFSKKPNQDGLSPLHLALQNKQTNMVRRLVGCESDLVRVRGREGKTPLHCVVEEGDICLLSEFLSICPQSILDVTIGSETGLHIAVRNFKFDAFDVLVGRLKRANHRGSKNQEKQILNWRDDEGNTALHVAALTKQHKVARVLIDCGVEVNVKNSEGLTALDILELQVQDQNSEIVRKILQSAGASNASSLRKSTKQKNTLHSRVSFAERLRISIVRYKKNMTSDTVNVQLVVAVLIATAAYQATLSPPGGLWQDNSSSNNTTTTATSSNDTSSSVGNLVENRAGKVIMGAGYFLCFWVFNTTALLTTTMAILFLIPSGYLSVLLITPLCLFFCCYVLSMSIVSPSSTMSSVNFYLLLLFSALLVIILTVMLSYRAVSKRIKRFLL